MSSQLTLVFMLNNIHSPLPFQKEKRNGEEMSAFDVFRSTHYGEKSGYSEPVRIALVSAASIPILLLF